ncbi:hypothetical protein TNCV_1475001 [Trichonephila clavipes]|nr:hypothetical protein TNCV_1475001 [Trichonephila clavipes]
MLSSRTSFNPFAVRGHAAGICFDFRGRPNSPVASTSKDGVIRCSACEQEYCDPPTEEWIRCCKCQEWWH